MINRSKKNKNYIKKILIVIAVLFAGFLTGTAAFGFMFFGKDSGGSPPTVPGSPAGENPPPNLDKRVSFLLIGADSRPGDESFNADTLIVASVDPQTKIISLLSIPRDTRVELAGSRFLKMNSMVMYRGIPGLMEKVTELTGIPLDGYIKTNFDGFKSIIDTLGGVDIYVEKDMYHETGDKEDGVIDLKQGQQRLTGTQALQYARYRSDSLADIGRTARQQNVIKAVAKEVLQVSTITKLPKLIPQVMDMVETNLSAADILKLSKAAVYFDSSNVVSQTLPGDFLDYDHISFWEVNREQALEVAQNLLLGITTDRVVNDRVIDLLDPEIRSHITVPGSPSDPNGVESPGHDEEENGDLDPDDGDNPEEGENFEEGENPEDGTDNEGDGTENGEGGSEDGEAGDGNSSGGNGTPDDSTGESADENQNPGDENQFPEGGEITPGEEEVPEDGDMNPEA